jgi:hypothetical protein
MQRSKKIALLPMPIILAAALGASGAFAATAKPINYDARAKQCQAATKTTYSGDGKVFAYGACLSNNTQESWGPSRAPKR